MSDRRLYIAGLSGTSAGAMNAVVMADGFIKDRRSGAIAAIREFWERVSQTGLFNDRVMAAWKMMSGKDNVAFHHRLDWRTIKAPICSL